MELKYFSEILNTDGGNKHYFNDLVEYGSTRVMPLLGAGTSCAIGLPAWVTLLQQMASIDEKCKDVVKHNLSKAKYEKAAESIVDMLGKNIYRDQLRRTLSNLKIDRLSLPRFFQLLPYVFSGPIATLNYDQVIETVFAYTIHAPLSVFVPMDDYQEDAINEALHINRHMLLKLHGSIDNFNSIVLSSNEYDKAYGKGSVDFNLPMPRIFKLASTSRAILFLGCSLKNDRFMDILQQINYGRNYAFLEFPETQDELSRRRKQLGEYRIFPIWYPNGADKTQAINLFIEELRIRWNISEPILIDEVVKPNLDSANEVKVLLEDGFEYAINIYKGNGDKHRLLNLLYEYKNKVEQLHENDIIHFGHYLVSNDTWPRQIKIKMPIPWIILKKVGTKLLLLSQYCLTWEFYHCSFFMGLGPAMDTTWEESTIREWLNNDWFSKYFTNEESKIILESEIITQDNHLFGTKGGAITKDKMFLLSADEITDSTNMRAELQMALESMDDEGIEIEHMAHAWWLRTPGETQNYVAVVDKDGQVDLEGIQSNADEVGVRPAMWIDIELITSAFL